MTSRKVLTTKNKKYFFIVFGAYPFGGALHNRILSLAKGLICLNVKVKVICVIPLRKGDQFENKIRFKDIYEGVEYEYAYKEVIESNRKVSKILNVLKGVIKTNKILKKESNKGDVLMLFPTKFVRYSIVFYIVSKLRYLVYAKEINEFPFNHRKLNLLRRISHKFAFKGFDLIFVMTKPLIKYYNDKVSRKAKLIHLPMTVDVSRFHDLKENRNFNNCISYCGDPTSEKDGVDILIKAFAIISLKHKDYKLCIIGGYKGKENKFREIEKLVDKNKLFDKVNFLGFVEREKIPEYLFNSKILVLARPNIKQSEGGFPTKLGEYLMTGKPVVLTKVGDIPLYLKDGESAFISEPDDAEKFANKLEQVIIDYNVAVKVGEEGKKVAIKNFNYVTQAKLILESINNL